MAIWTCRSAGAVADIDSGEPEHGEGGVCQPCEIVTNGMNKNLPTGREGQLWIS